MEKNIYRRLCQSEAAIYNRLNVLFLVKDKRSITRSEIANITNLRTSTVSYIIEDLKERNFIQEKNIKTRINAKGNQPSLLEIDDKFNLFVGVEVKYNSLVGVILNFKNEIIKVFSEKFNFKAKEDLEKKILKILKKNLLKYKKERIFGIGIGISGIVNPDKKLIFYSKILDLENIKFGEIIEAELNIPVFINNNANLAAEGEYYLYYRRKISNLLYIFYQLIEIKGKKEVGIGLGIILNKEIYYGENCSSGEIGEITAKYLNRNLNDILLNEQNVISIDKIRKLGKEMGDLLAIIINILNPGIVVIGGDLPLDLKEIYKYMKKEIEEKVLSFIKEKLEIKYVNDELAVPRGAAINVINKFFTFSFFKKYYERGVL